MKMTEYQLYQKTRCVMVTNEQIRILRREATIAGDEAQVILCNRSLAGEGDAIDECIRVIEEAKALGEE